MGTYLCTSCYFVVIGLVLLKDSTLHPQKKINDYSILSIFIVNKLVSPGS